MLPRLSAIIFVFLLSAQALAADPLAAVLPAESTTTGQRRTAALKVAREAVERLQKEKPATPAQEDLLFVEAIDDYQRLVEEAGDKLVPLDPSGRRHCVQARWLCALDISRLPPAALRVYRNRVDPQARKWFERGAAERDAGLLRRVVDEAFCSSHGDRALDLLGDLAFESGRFNEAERWWRQIARTASEARPKPTEDLELIFPDPKVDVARVRAKQVLARLFAGTPPDRLSDEVYAFRAQHGKAEGDLAGRKGNYADTLLAILERPDAAAPNPLDWPTFGGDSSRGRVLPPDPRDPNRLRSVLGDREPLRFNLQTHARVGKVRPDEDKISPALSTARSLAFHPVIWGTWVIVADARSVTAYDAMTGTSHTWDLERDGGHEQPRNLETKLPAKPDLRYTLTVADGKIYARLGAQAVTPDQKAQEADSFLVCLRLPLTKGQEDSGWQVKARVANSEPLTIFEGAPVAVDGRVYVAATRFVAGQAITSVRCYPGEGHGSPPLRWQQDVCATAEQARSDAPLRHHLLTQAGPNIVYCSHSGAVVALDARTGRPAWAVRYPSRGMKLGSDQTPPAEKPAPPRDLAPCVHAAGRLYVAPADHDRILCLDPISGRTLWEFRTEVVHLLGVSLGRLVFTTRGGIQAIDAVTGKSAGVRPSVGGALQPPLDEDFLGPERDGLAPFGRGFLAGELVFFPALHPDLGFQLRVLSVHDGESPDGLTLETEQKTRPPGNLVLGDGVLAVAGTETLTIFRSAALRVKGAGPGQRDPESAQALYDLGAARADAGEHAAALREFKLAERAAGDDFHFAEEARRRQREVLREQAVSLRGEKRWQEADAALAAAAQGAGSREQLARLADRTALWEEARQPAKAVAVWQSLLEEPGRKSGGLAAARIDDLIRRHGRGVYADVEREAVRASKGMSPKRADDLEALAARFPNSATAATALMELGSLHLKTAREGVAAHAYRRIVHNHRDSPERPLALVDLARLYERQELWRASRAAWERLSAEHGTQTIPAIAPGRVLREWVAEQMRRTEYAQPTLTELPTLAPPLTRSWQTKTSPAECLLATEPAGPELFFAAGNRLVCRDAVTGETRWEQSLGMRVARTLRHADTVIATGPSGVCCLAVDDGTLLWRHDPHGDALSFRLAGGRLFFLEDARRLFALDAEVGRVLWSRAAPGWSLGSPPLGGGFYPHYHADEKHLLMQTSGGRLWVLDAQSGATRHDLDGSLEPWPRQPLLIEPGCVALTADGRTVVLLDPESGKELARLFAGQETSLTGRAPLLAGGPDGLVVLSDRNHGSTLQCFDPRTGAARWKSDRLVSRESGECLTVDGGAAYTVCGGVLSAFSLRDGKLIWQSALPESGSDWQLLPCRDGIVAYPGSVGVMRGDLHWATGSVSLTGVRRTRGREPLLPVRIYDPEMGNLLQSVNRPLEATRVEVGGGVRSWLPSVTLERVSPVVQVWRGTLAVGVSGSTCGRTAARE